MNHNQKMWRESAGIGVNTVVYGDFPMVLLLIKHSQELPLNQIHPPPHVQLLCQVQTLPLLCIAGLPCSVMKTKNDNLARFYGGLVCPFHY